MSNPLSSLPFCQTCHAKLHSKTSPPLYRYCSICGGAIHESDKEETSSLPSSFSYTGHSLIAGHQPIAEEVLCQIGRYQILSSIGKGGMGEVFLAYDTLCGRRIALKRIRQDLLSHKQLFNRFLKEAHITSQLTHPSIIPIYTIHKEDELIYYTMPFVEGETLKERLRRAKKIEKEGLIPDPDTSISSLMRIFHAICNAVAYAHSHGVLHRDLKPENIMIGKFGEVHILDWGLAKLYKREGRSDQSSEEDGLARSLQTQTRLGKVPGTISYLAPERAFGEKASIASDIYSLGVILYQILTLRLPFKRKSLHHFRKRQHKELIKEPASIAPYRDVPKALSCIAVKSLAPDPAERYKKVEELLHDLENYIEGRSEWFQIDTLDIEASQQWEFQELVLLDKPLSLTQSSQSLGWVYMMISKSSYTGSTMLEVIVRCKEGSSGIGLMLCVPEKSQREQINDGYCLWIGSERSPGAFLLRSNVEVLSSGAFCLKYDEEYTIRIEKTANNLHVFVDGEKLFSFISYLPLAGTHVGLLCKERLFELHSMCVYLGSLNITVDCLAVPDAFLAHKQYSTALSEYRRIAYSFPGRTEGRQALFDAGITLLEQARSCLFDPIKQKALFEEALLEFEKQRNTPGAPLEYAGKALVYRALGDYVEEAKCYEIAFRRYKKHPLLLRLYEQLVYRMHESSKQQRRTLYPLITLCLRFLPLEYITRPMRQLFKNLQGQWEPLDFILESPSAIADQLLADQLFSIELAFWLAKPHLIEEIAKEMLSQNFVCPVILCNCMLALTELNALSTIDNLYEPILKKIAELLGEDNALYAIADLLGKMGLLTASEIANKAIYLIGETDELHSWLSFFVVFMRRLFQEGQIKAAVDLSKTMLSRPLNYSDRQKVDIYSIWALLQDNQWVEAGSILHSYPLELLSHESSLLHFLYGCWLLISEGEEMADIHFKGIVELAYPSTWNLASYKRQGKISLEGEWFENAFFWERRQLLLQLNLLYHCAGKEDKIEELKSFEKGNLYE